MILEPKKLEAPRLALWSVYDAYAGQPHGFVPETLGMWEYLRHAVEQPVSLRLHPQASASCRWIGSPESLEASDERCEESTLTIFTSGTTGMPKSTTHLLHDVLAKKRSGHASERWLLAYAPHRWAGLSVLLHVLRFGSTVIVSDSLEPSDVVRAGNEEGATHVSMTPSYLRRLLLSRGADALSHWNLKQVTFGGEAASGTVLNTARRLWPHARITHVYAMTEFGDVCSISDGLPGFPREKFARPGFLIGPDGELFIDGRATGDLWELRDGRYVCLGRREEVINVGGAKVFPSSVEAAVLGLDGVEDARAYGIPNALLGQVVGLDYRGQPDEAQLRRLLRTQLPKVAWPARVQRVDALPLTDANKLKRLGA